jgi:hypothetical protein
MPTRAEVERVDSRTRFRLCVLFQRCSLDAHDEVNHGQWTFTALQMSGNAAVAAGVGAPKAPGWCCPRPHC